MSFTWQQHNQIEQISTDDFSVLVEPDSTHATPFLSYHFLRALEQSASVGPTQTGWLPNHIGIYEDKHLVAFIPAYKKLDSYGEYVFDHSWANAYHHHDLQYYPKLVLGIPFTPVTGNRLLIAENTKPEVILNYLNEHIDEINASLGVSSSHLLFCSQKVSEKVNVPMMQRLSVQFVWQNNHYDCFQAFLDTMTSRRRRSIRKERAGVDKHGVVVKRQSGDALDKQIETAFYECYQQTYLKRSGHTGYLTKAFFSYVFEHMKDSILVVTAEIDGQIIASSLFFFNQRQLFGRYWGALTDISGLHFECCYYQGIEFAIERGIEVFNPGTQGEHKILRGFSPTLCYSNHYIAHPQFKVAIENFLKEESIGIQAYKERAATVLPYKSELIVP